MADPEQTGSFRDAAYWPTDARVCGLPRGTEVRDGWLTQFGTDDHRGFRAEPRWSKPEFDVSALVGKLTLSETSYAMFARKPRPGYLHRHFAVPRLVAASYLCLHTPRRKNPRHASILANLPGQNIEAHKAWWADENRKPLDSLVENGE